MPFRMDNHNMKKRNQAPTIPAFTAKKKSPEKFLLKTNGDTYIYIDTH